MGWLRCLSTYRSTDVGDSGEVELPEYVWWVAAIGGTLLNIAFGGEDGLGTAAGVASGLALLALAGFLAVRRGARLRRVFRVGVFFLSVGAFSAWLSSADLPWWRYLSACVVFMVVVVVAERVWVCAERPSPSSQG